MRIILAGVLLVVVVSIVVVSVAQRLQGAAQHTQATQPTEISWFDLYHVERRPGASNDRLKTSIVPDAPFSDHAGKSGSVFVEGIWMLESKDHDRPDTSTALRAQLPRLAIIRCEAAERKCKETQVLLWPTQRLVSVGPIDDYEYDVNSWDERGLIAIGRGYTGCQSKILTIAFASGAVSVSDIPTRVRGCEQVTKTYSYRLVRGKHYVDTTPNNDADKTDNPKNK